MADRTAQDIGDPQHRVAGTRFVEKTQRTGDASPTPQVFQHLAVTPVVGRASRFQHQLTTFQDAQLPEQRLKALSTATFRPIALPGHPDDDEAFDGQVGDGVDQFEPAIVGLVPPVNLALTPQQKPSHLLTDMRDHMRLADGDGHQVRAGIKPSIRP
ncbi:hypothetical protein [Herbidospora cretacea]|uniref:hypothetical protein n=1 Tax=Herbidospora cretacea TaxID=28444 RepID=UPI0012DD9B21|nr:hypothetical protein [Herbidospora cretacea]